jgi:hypothetical protein
VGVFVGIYGVIMKQDIPPGLALTPWLSSLLTYFLPSFVAYQRKARQRRGVVLLNVLIGWTELIGRSYLWWGWMSALIWAVVSRSERQR